MTKQASCLCGAALFHVQPSAHETTSCHCSMCRKWTGGAFLSVEVKPDEITVDNDETITTYASSPWAERAFCNTCGSSLWYRVTAPGPHHGMIYVGLGTFKEADGIKLTQELFIDHKPDGYSFAEETNKLTEAEVMSQFMST